MAHHEYDTIRKSSTRCLNLFAQNFSSANSIHQTSELISGTLENEFGRFKLWQSNIGVFANVHASLDFRLREIPHVAELFLRQLSTIEERLQQLSQMNLSPGLEDKTYRHRHEERHQCEECGRLQPLPSDTQVDLGTVCSICHTEDRVPRDHSSDAGESFYSWSRSELLQSVHESIDWLHRLSNMVRKASFNRQNKHADDFMLRDENGQKSKDLTQSMLEGLAQLYQSYIRTNAAGVGEPLAQRLIETMVIRHKRILYRRARRQTWNFSLTNETTRSTKIDYNSLNASQAIPELSTPNDPVTPGRLQPEPRLDTALSQATATTVDISMIRRILSPSTVSKATSNSLHVSDRDLLPPRPKEAKSRNEFICDYCGLLLQADQAADARAWAKHVKKDLDPYVCVFDECGTPCEIYSSSREWLSHMRSQHCMRWHCFVTSHEPSFFHSPEGLEEHLREIHGGHFSNEEISFLVESSSHPSMTVIESCPFCHETTEDIEEHVSRHLIQFALRSLPWPEDGCDSCHPSQSSHSTSSEGTNRDEDGMPEARTTDWDAWEREIQLEETIRQSGGQQHVEPPLTSETRPVVGLHEFLSPDYDAAEDDILEPFRRRAKVKAVPGGEQSLAERRATVRNFVHEEEIYVTTLNLLAKTYYHEVFREAHQKDEASRDMLVRNLDNLLILHKQFLNELKRVILFDWEKAQYPVSRKTLAPSMRAISSSTAPPELIGTVILEGFRNLGPAHEAYATSHQDAISIRDTALSHSLHQEWVQRRTRRQNRNMVPEDTTGQSQTGDDSSYDQFNDLLQYVNGRWYQNEHYATWLDRLSKKTPNDHPDKQPLLEAISYLQESINRAEPVLITGDHDGRRRNAPVQGVLDQGDQGKSPLSQVPEEEEVESEPEDLELEELFGQFTFDQPSFFQ